MLAAAALVFWGGERMSRHQVEARQAVDRARLLDFSASLGDELNRLDGLYQEHLTELGSIGASSSGVEFTNGRCEALIGVRKMAVYVPGGKKLGEYVGRKPALSLERRVPAIEWSGDGRSATALNVISLPKPAENEVTQPGSGWVNGADGVHRLFWMRTQSGMTTAVVIDDAELQACIAKHLEKWAAGPRAPLTDAGELTAVYGPRRSQLFPLPEDPGPAAMVVPHRTALGEWQVQAWDRLDVRTEHDMATLLLSCGIACTLVLAGIYLTIVQNRALKLAEERVSFVNRVSHELGTPLTNILLNLDLAGRCTESRPIEARRRLKLVDEEVRRLGRLVSNVLTFSRGERKALDLHPRDFIPDVAVAEVLSQFEAALERAGITIEFSGGAEDCFHGDPDAFSQIVCNLISNVEKYAATGGWVGIETRQSEGKLRIRVSDAGPGIPAKARARIFEAFERVSDGVAEGASGTGLGLAIARDLAGRMGGTLLLENSEIGAAFVLELAAPVRTPVLKLLSPIPAA